MQRGVDYAVPLSGAHASERRIAVTTGVIDEDLYGALLDQRFERRGALGCVGDIKIDSFRMTAAAMNFGG